MIMLICLVIPAYVANALPVALGGGQPIDNRKMFIDGKRLFGNSKTVRGFISGVVGGLFTSGLLGLLMFNTRVNIFDSAIFYSIGGVLMGLGTMVGDLIGSFLKRRLGLKESTKALLLDEIPFLIVALLFLFPIADHILIDITVINICILIAVTFVLHKITNFLANRIGMKKVPW